MSSKDDSRLTLKVLLTQTAVEILVFGCYSILFGISIYILHHRPPSHRKLHLIALTSLFLFATIGTALDIISTANDLYSQFDLGGLTGSFTRQESDILDHYTGWTVQFVYILADIIADAILIFRCYIIWGSRKRIIAFPMFIYIINNIIGLVYLFIFLAVHISDERAASFLFAEHSIYAKASQMSFAYMIITMVLNVLLTCLLAARIWWIQRQVSGAWGLEYRKKHKRVYHSIVSIIIESGLLYPTCLIIFNILLNTTYTQPNLFPLLTQLVGIAPTLIIVRVSLGISTDSVNDTLNTSSLRLSNRNGGAPNNLFFARNPEDGSSHVQSNPS